MGKELDSGMLKSQPCHAIPHSRLIPNEDLLPQPSRIFKWSACIFPTFPAALLGACLSCRVAFIPLFLPMHI